ncbi:MAG: nicotinate-nucleotide adenylyltransferase [Pseudomonadota bacterium]
MEKDRRDINPKHTGVGIFGGTFDPVHNGHLRVISHVRQQFSLSLVHLVLSSTPPHKTDRPLAPARTRMVMLRQAVDELPGLCASDIELRRSGFSFTIDTIEHFLAMPETGTDLYFILGSDAFADMGTWKRTRDIFRLASLIIMVRPGHGLDLGDACGVINTMLSERYHYDRDADALVHQDLKPVHLCRVPEMPISSTQIRNLIRNGSSISSLVPGPVEAIIREQGLYL